MKVIILSLLLFAYLQTNSTSFSYELLKEYKTLTLIENTMKWHSNSESVMHDMRARKFKTLKKIEELWQKQTH